MKKACIIAEFTRPGKQVMLEAVQGDFTTVYRITTATRYGTSLHAAEEAFLREIPENRREYFSNVVSNYSARRKSQVQKAAGKE